MPFSRTDAEMEMTREKSAAFTLIELLVVIVIIAVLMGLAFPVYQSVQNSAKKTQAKNDLTQIATAVSAFYTEYGKYPVSAPAANDAFFGAGADSIPAGASLIGQNDVLVDVLRNNTAGPNNSATVTSLNPRGIEFLNLRAVKDNSRPTGGVIPNGATGYPASAKIGVFYDPWGSEYRILIDTTYDNNLTNPYLDTAPPGGTPLTTGVIAWSFGKNGVLGGGAPATGFDKETGAVNNYSSSGDVISWQ
jgi:prepilin-type N-terminal cleavage/methylation domain-containing protein